MFHYITQGTCSREIILDIEDGLVKDVQFVGGCMGNTSGIASLARDRSADELIERLEGIQCGARGTSCPDQLAQALKLYLKEYSQGSEPEDETGEEQDEVSAPEDTQDEVSVPEDIQDQESAEEEEK